ncbi:hypothetical protein LSH36_918g00027 [Paralvinella palmiformis]|uniref:acetate--CoA ligase n=1 Tax=Paralvinella palmiformis TaxID=53620 RepID=A0AAD9MTT0_9ANNE|nr:hypothetical protein LSH36_918g00027 [Paralvinella palmiformis]
MYGKMPRMASKIIQCGAQLSGRLCGHVKVAHTKHVQKYLGVLPSPRLYSNSVSASTKSSAANSSIYDREFSKSLNNPTEYWGEAAEKLVWHKKWDRVIDDSKSPFTSWFVGGELNTCFNAVDCHVDRGHGNQTAIIHDSPVTETIRKITYNELLSEPKVIISANGGIEPGRVIEYKPLLDTAIELSEHKPQTCIIVNRKYLDKAVVRPIGGHAVVLHWSMEKIYGIKPGEGKPVGTPDPSTYYRILRDHDVAAMFVAPTAMRALRRELSPFGYL